MNKLQPLSIFLCLFIICLFACNRTPRNATPATDNTAITAEPTDNGGAQDDPDLVAITDAVHGFYKWYASGVQPIEYIDSKGKFSKLDRTKVAAYHEQMMKSGFLSKAYIDNDMAYLKKYEAIWKKDKENGNEAPLSGEDADRVFCGQDWEPKEYTTGTLKVDGLGTNQVKTTVGASQLELVKENGKWLIARIDCSASLPEPTPVAEKRELPYAITVAQKGNITLGGKIVTFDDLQKELQAVLVKQAVFPPKIPIKYEGEVLMGMRGEVETRVNEAIAGAKKVLAKKTSSDTKNKKSNTNTAPSALTIEVSNQGIIKVGGKLVSLDDLRKEVQNELVKKSVIPDKIPIKYGKEVLMGMRGEVQTEVNDAIAGAKWIQKSKVATTVAYASKSPLPPTLVMTEKGDISLSGRKIAWDDVKKEVQAELLKLSAIPDEIPIKSVGTVGMGMRAEVRTEVGAAIATAKWVRKKAALDALQKVAEKKLGIPIQFEVDAYKTSGNFAFAILTMKHKNGTKMDFKGTPFEKQYRLGGSISDSFFGLLKFDNGVWKILTYALGPTDVPHINWQKEYNAPIELFSTEQD